MSNINNSLISSRNLFVPIEEENNSSSNNNEGSNVSFNTGSTQGGISIRQDNTEIPLGYRTPPPTIRGIGSPPSIHEERRERLEEQRRVSEKERSEKKRKIVENLEPQPKFQHHEDGNFPPPPPPAIMVNA